ncbi:MAG: hypothetical protein NZM44_03945 [Candidatus Calescibacterium sp.]|nr:hypothetical protein [Candidatus Calescibacterium sp.]
MKKHFFFIYLILLTLTVNSQNNDPIKDFSGIPIISYKGLDFSYLTPSLFNKMSQSGVKAVVVADLVSEDFQNYLQNIQGLYIMPEQVSSNLKNYIYKYTEAIYSVWEAEGTAEEDGKVTLYSDSIECIKENGLVKTLQTTPKGTLIYGPMYSQQRHYAFVDSGQVINYEADFRLMIENTEQSNHIQMNDTVCIIQITTTKTFKNNRWGWYEVKVIADSVIKYGDFENVGQLQSFKLRYNLGNVSSEYLDNKINLRPLTFQNTEGQRSGIGCIEFKVIWKGNPQLIKLSVDKIVVSDRRGRELFNGNLAKSLILEQLIENKVEFGPERIAGWIGLDEPWALDFWQPIKRVQEILDSVGAKLYLQFNIGWNERFVNYNKLEER